MTDHDAPLLAAADLHKTYRKHAIEVPVLRGLDLHVRPGEFLSVVGASGSGKSTLLHLLGTLDRPDALTPDVHIYTRSRLPWVTLPAGVPAFEAYYDSKTLWPAESLERRRAVFAQK